jgi:intein/homing endonuclease
MSLKELQKYTFTSRYARYNEEKKRRETWKESVDRIRNMMLQKYPELKEDINWAYDQMAKKRVLGSQRALQFGGRPILKRNEKIYNCTSSYCDRLRFFQEAFFLLLCGCGTGFSVQKHHVAKLPQMHRSKIIRDEKVFVVPDSIEGWGDALGVLISSYFSPQNAIFPEYAYSFVDFDYSEIRPEGSPLSDCSGTAPGPEPLKRALEKIQTILDDVANDYGGILRPIDCYDIIMHASDAVLSGGVRRSSTICLFSLEDEEMMKAKTGNWFYTNPQRGRSNNSVVLVRSEVSKKQFQEIIQSTRDCGEPGFFWCEDKETLTNPCQPGWAKLLTKKGIRELKDVQIGDYIWSKEGFTQVVNKWSTGTKNVYKYTTTAGIFYGTEQHRIVSNGVKVEVGNAESIDIIPGLFPEMGVVSEQDIIDGLVIGDGAVHKASNNLVYLHIGQNDQDYFNHKISSLISTYRPGLSDTAFEVQTTITNSELPYTYERRVPNRFLTGDCGKVVGFLRGLYSANGSICGNRVTLKSSSLGLIEDVQMMLSSVGIRSYFTTNKSTKVKFENGEYVCKESYDLNISTDASKFQRIVGFLQSYKNEKLSKIISSLPENRNPKTNYDIIKVELVSREEVFDITVDNKSHTYWTQGCDVSNCVEIGLYGYDEQGNSGWEMCNLSTINCSKVTNEEDFYEACKAAAIIGTLQAGFDSFPYLGEVTERIVRREALIGVSMTGVMEKPEITLDERIQKAGAKIVKAVNKEIAAKIGIRQAARTTCIKPEGTSSCILGTSSGIHPHHAKRYIRNVQSNKNEAPYKFFESINPFACEDSVWSANGTDGVISFTVEVPDGAKLKNQVSAVKLLEAVVSTQQNWVLTGTNRDLCVQPWLNHNVSNTIVVKEDEWDAVADFIYHNKKFLTGVSLLPQSGDKDYPQAPFTAVFTPKEIINLYGDGGIFCSGIIEAALNTFGGDLWAACDIILGNKESNSTHLHFLNKAFRFAERYFEGDLKQMTYCLKDVYNWKKFVDLSREYKEVDYELLIESKDDTKPLNEIACAGGKCDLF